MSEIKIDISCRAVFDQKTIIKHNIAINLLNQFSLVIKQSEIKLSQESTIKIMLNRLNIFIFQKFYLCIYCIYNFNKTFKIKV